MLPTMPAMPSVKNSLITADVVLDAGHDRADAAPVDIADAEPLQVAEHLVADVEDDPVAEPGDLVVLAPACQEAQHQR